MGDSKQWLQRHVNDHYVKQAERDGYVSRAAYKLLEIAQKDRLLKPGMRVVDLGAAPGGWSQVAAEKVGAKGEVLAIDRLPLTRSIPRVHFIQGDFDSEETYQALLDHLDGQAVDLVLSDLAPNLSGNKSIDQPRVLHLVELAVDFAQKTLKPGGCFLVKLFQGAGVETYAARLRPHFKRLQWRKPKASRPQSREVYLLARDFKPDIS